MKFARMENETLWKRCDRLGCDVGLSMLPLTEGGEDRAKQSLSQPRGDRDQT